LSKITVSAPEIAMELIVNGADPTFDKVTVRVAAISVVTPQS
jgi:hypothetical protein